MWSLPPNRRTAALTDLIEAEFYKRIPPEQRPKHLRGSSDPADAENDKHDEKEKELENRREDEGEFDAAPSTQNDPSPTPGSKSKGKVKTKKTKDGTIEGAGEEKYGKRPLLAAVHAAFFWRWWTAGLLLLIASASSVHIPFFDHK